ncbi:MAG: TnpV protein [Clostridia bacterium]|nr:TnpV protein [Clostridia bacterium]
MEKYVIDERTGWEYELKGEQYYPTGRVQKNGVMTPSEPPKDDEPEEISPVGIWGQRHLQFISQHRKCLYLDLYMADRLNAYLAEIETQAEDLFSRIVKEMAAKEGITEKLKAEDQMRWVGMMNNIRNSAAEIVNSELIFA